jgi:CheY-like chemotaxis protein
MKKHSGSAVLRHQVFVLADGNFVVQWDEKRIQELLSGRYRDYDHKRDFGHLITDYELKQLKAAGRVENYNRMYVWLFPLPETGRFGHPKTMDRGDRIRAYYLSSTLPKTQLSSVQSVLGSLNLNDEFLARSRNNMVVILGKNGMPFRFLREAENAQKMLQTRAPQLLADLAVAFVETKADANYRPPGEDDLAGTNLNLAEIIASQSDTTVTEGKRVILAVRQDDERAEFTNLFANKMKMDVKQAATGQEALQLAEDGQPDLMVTDSQLSDMHVWQMLNKAKEISQLRDLLVIVITDEPSFGATVAKVEHLVRPVSIQRLRHSVWTVLKHRANNLSP